MDGNHRASPSLRAYSERNEESSEEQQEGSRTSAITSFHDSDACDGRDYFEIDFESHSNWTLVVAANYGYMDFFENWWFFFKELNITNKADLIVLAEDEEAYKDLLNMSFPPQVQVVPTHHDEKEKQQSTPLSRSRNKTTNKLDEVEYDSHHAFGTEWYKRLVSTRPTRLLSVLCSPKLQVENLVYGDIDSVWRKDPLPHVEAALHGNDTGAEEDNLMDIVAQMDNPETDPVGYCTGFLGMRNTPKLKQFLVKWEQAIAQKWEDYELMDSGDQPVFVEVIHGSAGRELGIRHAALPMDLFPAGRDYFDQDTSDQERERAVVVHNNWIVGHHNKKMRFALWHLWKGKDMKLQANNGLAFLYIMRMRAKHKEEQRRKEMEMNATSTNATVSSTNEE